MTAVKKYLSTALLVVLVGSAIGITPANAATPVTSCSTIKIAPGVTKGITLPCLDGRSRINFQAIRGPVVVNVFGSWCEPCQQEIPHFLDLAKSKKVAIVGIDVEESSVAAGRAFVAKKAMNWPILFDLNSVTRGLFGMGVPVTWFIDATGKVTYKQVGIITSDAILNNEVKRYLGITL